MSKFSLFSPIQWETYLDEERPRETINTVTIFISGFLTANKNSFAEYFEDYFFKDNEKSKYYFYLWPSCEGIDSDKNIFEIFSEGVNLLKGLGCSFEEAYANAEISGEILSHIIGSQKFFNKKVNLVGHSLGCRVIYNCLKHFKKNYKTLKGIINDVIFLAGATEMDDSEFNDIVNEFIGGRVIHCFNANDEALFISTPFSNSPIGIREILKKDKSKIENYETDLSHMNYCNNLGKILEKINNEGNGNISFI